jgi:hypothetical protein
MVCSICFPDPEKVKQAHCGHCDTCTAEQYYLRSIVRDLQEKNDALLLEFGPIKTKNK